jgi:hypothetical protein
MGEEMSSCYSCETKVKHLASGIGTISNPIGCCHICHVLACGYHAHRDASVPEFICVECDPNLLAASAGMMAPVDSSIAQELASYYLFSGPPFRETTKDNLFRSVNDFIERRPRYGDEFLGKLHQVHFTSQPWEVSEGPGRAALQLPEESKDLLAAAVALSHFYNVQQTPRLLRELKPLLPSGWEWK